MLRKAKIAVVGQKLDKNSLVTVEIMESFFETYASAIKQDSDALRDEMNQRLNKQDGVLQTILHIVTGSDVERQEMRSELWLHDKRISKLEKQLV
ncbi:MAG: hypothetical protein WCV73_00330 [Patescibacteria group bacterium]|jgi:hypothetical protein